MKNIKYWLYPVCGIVPFLALSLPLIFGAGLPASYGICYGLLLGAFSIWTARLILHCVTKATSRSFIASQVWYAITLVLFVLFILNESSSVQTMLVFGIMASCVNSLGFRFIAEEKSEDYPAKSESRKDAIERLASTLRYRYLDDGITPNYDSPLCYYEGNALTAKEAEKKGLGAMYASAIEYIKTFL